MVFLSPGATNYAAEWREGGPELRRLMRGLPWRNLRRRLLVAAYWLVLFLVALFVFGMPVGGVVGLLLSSLLALLMLWLVWRWSGDPYGPPM